VSFVAVARTRHPGTALAFALRRDMDWVMAGAYWVVQFAAAICGSLSENAANARS
jgi:glycerol uptake facilitator-like aquaporin